MKNIISKIQYVSDIHLEYKNKIPKLKKTADTLALLGDIGNPTSKIYVDFLKYASDNWSKVYLLAGNHEYLNTRYNINDINTIIQDNVSKFPNIDFLNNKKVYENGVSILGTTLWTSEVSYSGTKYNTILKLHENAVLWLEENINKSTQDMIILTHHLPTYKLINGRYTTGAYKNQNKFFATNLEHLIKPPVRYWLCGHSHCNYNVNINGVFCAINAYPFNNDAYITI